MDLYHQLSVVNRSIRFFLKSHLRFGDILTKDQWRPFHNEIITLATYKDAQIFIPLDISINNFHDVRNNLSTLKQFIKTCCEFEHRKFLEEQIVLFVKARCEHMDSDTTKFINSALSRRKDRIILDRVLIEKDNDQVLLNESEDVQRAVTHHYQTVAGLSPLDPISMIQHSDR